VLDQANGVILRIFAYDANWNRTHVNGPGDGAVLFLRRALANPLGARFVSLRSPFSAFHRNPIVMKVRPK